MSRNKLVIAIIDVTELKDLMKEGRKVILAEIQSIDKHPDETIWETVLRRTGGVTMGKELDLSFIVSIQEGVVDFFLTGSPLSDVQLAPILSHKDKSDHENPDWNFDPDKWLVEKE